MTLRLTSTNLIALSLSLASALYCASISADTGYSRYEVKNLLRFKIAAIKELAADPVIVDEVRKRNEQNIKLSDIQALDRSWSEYSSDHPEKRKMFSTKAGRMLKDQVEFDSSIFSEIFLTDNQGANITAWPVTSDYWQGDEAKWHRSFNNGEGDVYIGRLEYDESSQSNAIQISVPVMDDNRAIGVLIAGIKLSYLQAKYLSSKFRDSFSDPSD